MTAYVRLPVVRCLALGVVALIGSGCVAAGPQVNVLGVAQNRSVAVEQSDKLLVVFVEVVNPTGRALNLSRLEYNIDAAQWFRTKGRVVLSRAVPAGSSAVVEIPVPLESLDTPIPPSAAYELKGKLFAVTERIERSWNVRVKGALSHGKSSRRVRVKVAAAE